MTMLSPNPRPVRRVHLAALAAVLALPGAAAAQTTTTPGPDVTTPPPATDPTTTTAAAPPAVTVADSRVRPPADPAAPTAAARVVDPVAPTLRKTWSGRVIMRTVARAAPSKRARVVARVSPYGPYDRDPQYLLMFQSRRVGATIWYRVLLPQRPNGTTAWVAEDALQLKSTPLRLRVDLSARTLTMMSAGRTLMTRSVAVGTNANPTPTGLFALSEIVPQGKPNGFFGPFILTITAHSDNLSDFDGGNGQVALHGTSLPGLLGRAVSHGCVRISNSDIRTIARRVPRGAPVEIVP